MTGELGHWHVGRMWGGHAIEDDCPCPQEPCGLVDITKAAPECEHHPFIRCRSLRQGHRASECPGTTGGTP